MARRSAEAESVAKHAKVSKNCFTPFLLDLDRIDAQYEFYNNKTARVINWSDAEFFGLLNNFVALTNKQKTGTQINSITLDALSKGFIYKLFETAKVWATEGLLYLPRLSYFFSRLDREYGDILFYRTAIKNLKSLLFSPDIPKRENSIKIMTLVLNWLELLQRSK